MEMPRPSCSGWRHATLREQAEIVMQQFDELPSRIRSTEVSGEAGNGSVVAFADGTGTLTRMTIDDAAARDNDPATLGRMIVEAIESAEDAAFRARRALLDEMTFAGHPIMEWLPGAGPPTNQENGSS